MRVLVTRRPPPEGVEKRGSDEPDAENRQLRPRGRGDQARARWYDVLAVVSIGLAWAGAGEETALWVSGALMAGRVLAFGLPGRL